MLVRLPHEAPFSDVDVVGIALQNVGKNQNTNQYQYHIGLLYKSTHEDGGISPKFLHLGWQNRLLNDSPNDCHLWLDLGEEFDEFNKPVIEAFIKLVAKNNPSSGQYGFDVNTKCLDPNTGKFVEGYDGKIGLTCATFVLEVFSALDMGLVLWDTWPLDDENNNKWQEFILSILERNPDSKDYAELQRNNIGNPRFLPTEVAAATQINTPSCFDDLQPYSNELGEHLKAQL